MTEYSRPSLLSSTSELSARIQAHGQDVQALQKSIQWQVNETVSEYQRQQPELLEKAQLSLETIIQPWWRELEDHGVIDAISALARIKQEGRIVLSQSKPFLYPKEALRIVSLSSQRDVYHQEAVSLIRTAQNIGLPEFKKDYRELYQGRFFLGAGETGAKVSYTYGAPNGPFGFVGGLAEQSRTQVVNLLDSESVINSVHYQPLIDLGNDIQSLNVSDAIEAYLYS